jgi:hypothetical protein
MSSPRIVVSAAAVIVAVVAAGWYASSAFPILVAAPALSSSPEFGRAVPITHSAPLPDRSPARLPGRFSSGRCP